MALLLSSPDKFLSLKHFIFAKPLPIAGVRSGFWFFFIIIIMVILFKEDTDNYYKYISENIGSYELYLKAGIFLLAIRLLDTIASYSIYNWADLYGLDIISIKAIDIMDRKFSFTRLISREYSVKVKNEAGEEGEVLIWFIYQQIANPFVRWVSEPLTSIKIKKVVPNHLPD